VKLFAAIGAIAGVKVGLEVELVALVVACVYALGRLAWHGKLLRTLGNSFALAFNPVLPKKWKRTVTPELMHRLRLGAPIFVGALVALGMKYSNLWKF